MSYREVMLGVLLVVGFGYAMAAKAAGPNWVINQWRRFGFKVMRLFSLGTYEPDDESPVQRAAAVLVGAAATLGVLVYGLYSLAPRP